MGLQFVEANGTCTKVSEIHLDFFQHFLSSWLAFRYTGADDTCTTDAEIVLLQIDRSDWQSGKPVSDRDDTEAGEAGDAYSPGDEKTGMMEFLVAGGEM